jgi:pSer/pThr/pTyr-binding forkhead associated (FHA) protein
MNAFMKACEISGPLQLSVRGPSPDESGVRLLHQPFALIGRDQRADVPLDHKLVSRRHVYLQIVESQAFWLDLDSRSGTSTEGQLRKFGWLEAGKPIRIGPFELQRLPTGDLAPENRAPRPGPRISPLVARSYGDQPLPEVSLEFLNGPSRSACWPMNRVMSLIGSASGCKFRLADPSVSPFHCSLLRTPLGLLVVDLLGPEGIGVNDALVRYALLAANDVLRVGRYRIRIQSRLAGRDPEGPASGDGRRTTIAVPQPTRQAPLPYPAVFSNGDLAGSLSPPANSWQLPASDVLASRAPTGHTSSIEWTSPADNAPIRLEKGELTEAILVPLMNQFGQMQQQMLDQFQQAISMIVQMFGTLHRDQMVTIREELDQLRDLTREFHALKLELAARSQHQTPVVPANPSTALGGLEIPEAGPGVEERVEAGTGATVNPGAARIAPESAPVSPILSAEDGSPIASSFQAPLDPSATERPEVKKPQTGESNLESDRDVMVWLHQRMMVLQQERESRWRKILKLLPGLS